MSLHSSPTKSNSAGNRIKRTTSSVIEKSFLQDLHARNQKCQLPCQRQPLLVDKKKILAYLGFGHLVKQLNGFGLDLTVALYFGYFCPLNFCLVNQNQDNNNFIDIGQCDGNCRSSQYNILKVSFS